MRAERTRQAPSEERTLPHLSHSVSGALRTFSCWMANGTVGQPLLDGIDYSSIFQEPSALEQACAICAHVLEFDDMGRVVHVRHAERRGAQFILEYVTGKKAEPPLAAWEVKLYDPPRLMDFKGF